MDNDERDRRDWPEADQPEPLPGEPAADSGAQPTDEGPTPAEPMPDLEEEPAPSAAEIESWPSQDATRAPAEPERAWPTEPPAAGTAAEWPTEAPEAGSGTGWSTTAPERGAEPAFSETPYEAPAEASSDAAFDPAFDAPGGAPGESGTIPEEPAQQPPSEIEAYPAAPAAEEPGAAVAAAGAAHAVPEAASTTGESTLCPRCGTENRPGLSFCNNCGQRLVAAGVAATMERPGTPEGTQACPRCGTHNRAGVAFCQNCGANLRGTAPGYVPPAVAVPEAAPAEAARRGAVLGPVVLLIGLVGLVTGYLLPFLFGSGSLFERAFGGDGYGVAFWNAYDSAGTALADQAYFGLAAAVPLLGLLLLVLAIAGFVRAAPGMLQTIGLVIALLWSIGFIVLFGVLEVAGNWGGDLIGLLRDLSPAGIIFFLASLIVLIGTLTRFARS